MKLFVPGRLCLFGEHSDWAGGYRLMNPQIEKGYHDFPKMQCLKLVVRT
ncbi:galactokinase family protein [Okeania sp. SIO3I5]